MKAKRSNNEQLPRRSTRIAMKPSQQATILTAKKISLPDTIQKINECFVEHGVLRQKPKTAIISNDTSHNERKIAQLNAHTVYLQNTIKVINERTRKERQSYENLIKLYRDQQKLLWERLNIMQRNYTGYRQLTSTLQSAIISLRARLRMNGIDIDESENSDSENENEE